MKIIILILIIVIMKNYLTVQKFIELKNRSLKRNRFKSTMQQKVNYGKELTMRGLDKLPGDNKLVRNLYIKGIAGNDIEIDLIMINETGIYVFEVNYYSGWIYGDEKEKKWIQILKGGEKKEFNNPIHKNKATINTLRKFTKGVPEEAFYSYIVFSEESELRYVTFTTPRIDILKKNKLLSRVDMDVYGNFKVLSKEKVNEIYMELMKYSCDIENTKHNHGERIKVRKQKEESI